MMADVSTAEIFEQPLDPHETLDFKLELADILEADEEINPAAWAIEVPVEGAGAGLSIMVGGGRDPVLADTNKSIIFWLTIDEVMRNDPIFDGVGTTIPLRVTGTTNTTPTRVRQRTVKVKVAHQ